MSIKLFVYGTLKVGGTLTNKMLDKRRVRVDDAVLSRARLYNLGSFPGVVLNNSEKDVVYGEIHEYEDEKTVIDIMDHIEGYDQKNPEKSLFIRKKQIVYNKGTDEYEEVFFYEFNKQSIVKDNDEVTLSEFASVIKSGKWD